MSTIQVYFEYYRYFLLGNKFSEQDAARGESLRGAGGLAGHYLCGEVDPAPATPAAFSELEAVENALGKIHNVFTEKHL